MAAKYPLNKFRSKYATDITVLSAIYTGQDERATIIIQAQASNPTNTDQTITLKVSSNYTLFTLLDNFPIPAYDARSLVTGRLVIQGKDGSKIINPDILFFKASSPDVVLSLGLLETKNTD